MIQVRPTLHIFPFLQTWPFSVKTLKRPKVFNDMENLVKSAAGPILIKPVIIFPAVRSPVNGESKNEN